MGIQTFTIDGSNIDTKQALLENIADTLALPDYMGLNWDALEECLIDEPFLMTLQNSVKVFILFFNFEDLISKSPDIWDILVEICESTSKFWKQYNRDVVFQFM